MRHGGHRGPDRAESTEEAGRCPVGWLRGFLEDEQASWALNAGWKSRRGGWCQMQSSLGEQVPAGFQVIGVGREVAGSQLWKRLSVMVCGRS